VLEEEINEPMTFAVSRLKHIRVCSHSNRLTRILRKVLIGPGTRELKALIDCLIGRYVSRNELDAPFVHEKFRCFSDFLSR
jgi:hypothetical protein